MNKKLHLYSKQEEFDAVLDGLRVITRPLSTYYIENMTYEYKNRRYFKNFSHVCLHTGKHEGRKSLLAILKEINVANEKFTIHIGDITSLKA